MTGKDKILAAAKTVIIEKGVEGATVREIAKEAGLTTGAIYHHYKNKDEILYEVLNSEYSITNNITKLVSSKKVMPQELLDAIRAEIERRMGDMVGHKLRFHLSREAALGNTEVRNRLAETYIQWTDRTASLFAPAFDIEESPKARGAAILMIAALEGIANLEIMDVLPFNSEEIADIYKEFFTYCIPLYLSK